MKIRAGFVANSSSSSFLIWGVERREFRKKFDDHDRDLWQIADELDLRTGGDGEVVGAAVFFDDYGDMSSEELEKDIAEAKEKMAKAGFSDCRFYYGVERG